MAEQVINRGDQSGGRVSKSMEDKNKTDDQENNQPITVKGSMIDN